MLKLDIRYIVGESFLCCAADGVPSLENFDSVSFSEESLEHAIKDYIYYDCKNNIDNDDIMYAVDYWLYNDNKNQWFDIKKDVNGNYYFVAGDETGIVYFGYIDRVATIFDDYEVGFNEDEAYYYIDFQNKSGEYYKEKWSLENAILDMKHILEEEF